MLKTANEELFWSPGELSQKFKISLSSVYKLIRSGEIPSIRLGKVYRIPHSDLDQSLQGMRLKRNIQSPIPETAVGFVKELKKWRWKDRIQEVYLYGSYARGDYDEDSDIDLYVVADQADLDMKKMIDHIAEKAMFDLDYKELLSVRTEGVESWNRMKENHYPLVQNILREGVPIWKNR